MDVRASRILNTDGALQYLGQHDGSGNARGSRDTASTSSSDFW